MPETTVTMQPVSAKQWEVSRVVRMPSGQHEAYALISQTQQDLLDALRAHVDAQGQDLADVQVLWTCSIKGTSPLEPQKIDLHPGAPGARGIRPPDAERA